jgi:hypothetical protein
VVRAHRAGDRGRGGHAHRYHGPGRGESGQGGADGGAAVHDRVDPGLGLGAGTLRRRVGRRAEQRGQGGTSPPSRAEPEIVFLMGTRLAGPGVTAATALAAVTAVYGGIEVIDSRYRDFRFTLPDVVADNASSGCFATGPSSRTGSCSPAA